MKADIPGYEGMYSVDENGNVWVKPNKTHREEIQIKPYDKNGYLAINANRDKHCTHFYVHRLVAQLFIPNPNNYKEVNHLNCDKHDNRVSNLEWCDRRHNLEHAWRNGLKRTGETHGGHKLTWNQVHEIKNLLGTMPETEIAKRYGMSISVISSIKVGRTWKEGDANEIYPNETSADSC